MRKTTRLKELILAPELLVMPGAFDPLSARIVQEAGFLAIQCSGYAISVNRLGLPDYSFLAMSDMVAASQIGQKRKWGRTCMARPPSTPLATNGAKRRVESPRSKARTIATISTVQTQSDVWVEA